MLFVIDVIEVICKVEYVKICDAKCVDIGQNIAVQNKFIVVLPKLKSSLD